MYRHFPAHDRAFFSLLTIRAWDRRCKFIFCLVRVSNGETTFLHQTPIPLFYKRRISRIFPTLYLFIIVTIMIYLVTGVPISW